MYNFTQIVYNFTQVVYFFHTTGSYVSQCYVNFLNSGLTVYQFCNFKHSLKAESSEDSLASSSVEFSIGLSCKLLELTCTQIWP